MGSANVIPGVSGGTIAFITGIYEELINSIRKCVSPATLKMALKFDVKGLYNTLPWRFLLALCIGIAISFATMAKLFVWLLENHPKLTYAFFFGLIAASIITMAKKVDKWNASAIISAVVGAAAAYGVITMVPMSTPDTWWMMFLCGFICIVAMILPGLSGSFLLLILGQYERIWQAVSDVCALKATGDQFVMIFWVAIGCAAGLGSFVHLLNYLMRRFKDATTAALIGFMVGTLPRIWPYIKETDFVLKKGKLVATKFKCMAPEWNITLLWVTLVAVAGFVIVFAIEKMAEKGQEK
jgi:putative membrane protein